MRMVISRDQLCSHEGSMRCERCFPQVIEMKKDGICVLDQVDDGQEALTLVIVESSRPRTFVLTEAEFAPFVGEDWATVLAGIEPYEISMPDLLDEVQQYRADDNGMPHSE